MTEQTDRFWEDLLWPDIEAAFPGFDWAAADEEYQRELEEAEKERKEDIDND